MTSEAERGAPRPDNPEPQSVRNGSTEPNRTSDNLAPDDSIGAIQAHEIDRLRAERDAEAALADQLANAWWKHSTQTLNVFHHPAFTAWRLRRRTKNESEQH